MVRYEFPVSVKQFSGLESCENLLLKKQLQVGLNEQNSVKFRQGSSVVLDFGREMRGGVRILTVYISDLRYAKVRIRFGESLTECNADLGFKNATNDHSPRDIEVELSSWCDLSFGDTGFRFVRLDWLSPFEGELKAVVAKSYTLNKKANYVYTGGDNAIGEIYTVAKRTIDLCSVGGYVYDGIKRDRLVWVGDMYPEMLALTTLYGEFPALERSLDFAKKQYPLPQFMYDMPTYSLWWIIIICDYFDRTHAEKFTLKQLKYMDGLLDLSNERIDENGYMSLSNYFVDWPSKGSKDEYAGAVYIAIAAYQKAIHLLDKFGYSTDNHGAALARLQKNTLKIEEKKQVIGLKYFATGELTDDDYAVLIKDGCAGFSTFMSYFILKAIASRDSALAVELMKEYYGAMIDLGATTFFEDFDISWTKNANILDSIPSGGQKDIHGDFGSHCYVGFRHSLCHGWSSAVITFMQENIG